MCGHLNRADGRLKADSPCQESLSTWRHLTQLEDACRVDAGRQCGIREIDCGPGDREPGILDQDLPANGAGRQAVVRHERNERQLDGPVGPASDGPRLGAAQEQCQSKQARPPSSRTHSQAGH
jgi:hypothetical protein